MVKAERVSLDGLEIKVNANSKRGVYLEIIMAAKDQLDAMLSHYARVLFIRLDIRQHDYSPDNTSISRYMNKIVKRLKRRYCTNRIGFVWVREVGHGPAQHYHLCLMLDGRAVRHPGSVIALAEEIAEGWGWPKPYTPERCYYLIHRNDLGTYQEALYRASYLAKERSKGIKATTANNYGRSNVKAREGWSEVLRV